MLAGSAAMLRDRASASEGSQGWREFTLATRIDLPVSPTVTRAWVPLPLLHSTAFQQPVETTVRCEGGTWTRSATHDTGMITATFPAGSKPLFTVRSVVKTRDWDFALATPSHPPRLPAAERETFLRPTRFVPTDGLVRSTAMDIVRGPTTDENKARAIYEWIVTHAYRKATVRGCGRGDIRALLATGDLGGKCADLSALFVGLARAAGLPAREVYGIRVAPSRLGYQSLGPSTEVVSRAQHCRAEVWLAAYGWVPVDPADVRKVMLEEPPGALSLDDAKVRSIRQRLFGSWEMNWVAYNYGQDVRLPGSDGPVLPFLMYPQAERTDGRLDSLSPDTFQYAITAVEV